MRIKSTACVLLLAAPLCDANAQATQLTPRVVRELEGLIFNLDKTVLGYWRQIYTYPIKEQRIPSNICTDFYNDLVKFNNTSLQKFSREYPEETLSLPWSLMNSALSSAMNTASNCSYENELGLTKFELYKNMYDRDKHFLQFVLGTMK